MKDLNRVELIGRIGVDPELKVTSSDKKVCNFTLATGSRYKKGDEWVEQTYWHRITVWGSQAEFVAEKCQKGSVLHVEGEIRYVQYDVEGSKRQSTEIHASEIRLLRGPGEGKGGGKRRREEYDAADDPF